MSTGRRERQSHSFFRKSEQFPPSCRERPELNWNASAPAGENPRAPMGVGVGTEGNETIIPC